MSPVASYPHAVNEEERNFGAHIPTLIELIESGGLRGFTNTKIRIPGIICL